MIRIVLHIVLILLVTAKILIWNANTASYVRSMQQTYAYIFATPVASFPVLQRFQLFGYNETEVFATRVLQEYATINNVSTAEFNFGTTNMAGDRSCIDSPVPPMVGTSCSWTSATTVHCSDTSISSVNDFPFLQENRAEYFSQLDSFQLTFDLCNYVNAYRVNHDCHYWRIKVVFRSIALMYLEVVIESDLIDECEQQFTTSSIVDHSSFWLDIFSIIFSLVYLGYILTDVWTSIVIYNSVKQAHAEARAKYLNRQEGDCSTHEIAAQYTWEEIPTGVKRSLHNYWSLITLIAVVFNIIQAFHALSDPYDDLENLVGWQQGLLGVGILLLWMTIVQFLSVQSPIYAIAATVQMAMPRVLAFLTSFLPVYFAFLFLGMALFGAELGFFGTVELSSKFLFTLMAGDSVMQIMQLLSKRSIWAALLFGISFTLVTAYLLINILVAIVEEAYFVARKQGRHLELLMWRNLQRIARDEAPWSSPQATSVDHRDPSTSSNRNANGSGTDVLDVQSSRIFFSANVFNHLTSMSSGKRTKSTEGKSKASDADQQQAPGFLSAGANSSAVALLGQLRDLDLQSPHLDDSSNSSSSSGQGQKQKAKSLLLPDTELLDVLHNSNTNSLRSRPHNDGSPAQQQRSRQYQRLVEELLQATMPDSAASQRQEVSPDDLTISLAEETAEMYILGRHHWEYSKMMDYIAAHLNDN